jgi:hypothetical protein
VQPKAFVNVAQVQGDFSRLSAADELFFRLDGRLMPEGGRGWLLLVCGIHADGANRWIQATVSGLPGLVITLRVGSDDSSDEILRSIHGTVRAAIHRDPLAFARATSSDN